MTQQKLWKVQELSTNGWTSIDPQSDNLNKEQCDRWLNVYMDDGIAPNRLRAVPSQTPDEGLPQLDR